MVIEHLRPVPEHFDVVAASDDPASFAAAIISLFSDRDHLSRVGEAGRQRVTAEFSRARMVEKTLQFYHDVAAKTG